MDNLPEPLLKPESSGEVPIPVVMVTQADGLAMKEALLSGKTVTLRMEASVVVELTELTDQIFPTSSRGPGSPDSQLKPDIAAPGHRILSAKAGGGVQGVEETGTSMASPVIAGAAALMRQAHPEWSTLEIKAALMNTATTMRDGNGNPYAESRVGAGRVRPDAAVGTSLVAYADDDSGRVSVSFGALLVTNTYRETRTIRVVNHGLQDADLDVSVAATVQRSGFSLVPKVPTVRVSARGSATVEVELTVDPSRLDVSLDPATASRLNGKARAFPNEASGLIRFSNAQGRIQVPYYAQVRAGSDWQSTTRTLRLPPSTYSQERVDVSLGFQGFSAHTNPVVSVFELGVTSLPIYDSDYVAKAGDLLAVGAATDGPVLGDLSKATVSFGLVAAGPWNMPTPELVRMEVAIDTNGDNEPEFVVKNKNIGAGFNDVLETTVTPTGGSPMPGLPLNVWPPDLLDTAIVNNSVVVMPIPASSIGLGTGQTAFRYRVRTYCHLEHSVDDSLIDGTDWISFDVARPIVDTVWNSPTRKPLFTDGKELQVRLDRSAALASQVRMPGVLLLHHFNPLGRRHEVVRIDDSGYQPVTILPTGVGSTGNPARFEFRYSGPAGVPMVVERSRNLV
ncbi:MAG: S8 family serine peptidase, partial [Ilumatobacteraceae bacterium]